jgi:hypothetical protein
MSVYLARSECRKGHWHVITYDISDPDNWIEIDDQSTAQPCSQVPQVTALRRELYEKLLRPTTVGLIAPNGDRITFTLHPNGVNVLQHETAKGEVIQKTCSGKCGTPPNQTTVGPIPCPSGSGFLDCTKNPPTLTCDPAKAGGRAARRVTRKNEGSSKR